MATIAEQLTSLANTKTAIKDAIIARGVSVSDSDTFRSYATKIGEIGETVDRTKFGASVDTFIGNVVDGVLRRPTTATALNFAGVTEIYYRALYYAFYQNQVVTSVDLSSLQSVDNEGLQYAFYYCSSLTSVDLSSLQSVGYQGMIEAFSGCSSLTSVDLSSLQSVDSSGLNSAFSSCSGLTAISFPALTSVQTSSFGTSSSNFSFRGCTNLTEIHFRADMQATIEAMTGYADKFGATNATIYFDL